MADILVVDDDPDVLLMLKCLLERHGHRVTTVSNGVEALRVLPEEGVHLVVTDIKMPDLDGFELIPELLERFPEQKIIAISSGDNWEPKDHLHAARDLGAVGCIQKPFDLDDFYECVNAFIPAES